MGLDRGRNRRGGSHRRCGGWGRRRLDLRAGAPRSLIRYQVGLNTRLRQNAAILAIAAFLLLPGAFRADAEPPVDSGRYNPDIPAILSAAETLFQALKSRDYPTTWRVLTEKSREKIVSETGDAILKTGGPPASREYIRTDFAAGGPISREYWEGFLRRFNPDDALEKSRWEMGASEKDRAEVLITHPGADRPAVLRMYREGDGWKAGLVETFWEH